jgi:hypothetical protein
MIRILPIGFEKPLKFGSLVVLVARHNHRRHFFRSIMVYRLPRGTYYILGGKNRPQTTSASHPQEWLGSNHLLHTHLDCGSTHSGREPNSSSNGTLPVAADNLGGRHFLDIPEAGVLQLRLPGRTLARLVCPHITI